MGILERLSEVKCYCPKLSHVYKINIYSVCWASYKLLLVLILVTKPSLTHTWEHPGCHRVGHTRTVEIPDCLVFNVTLNACRGFCESYAIPSPSRTLRMNNQHIITSRAECCSIAETHDVKVLVKCIDGTREVTFKSAMSCACSICRRD